MIDNNMHITNKTTTTMNIIIPKGFTFDKFDSESNSIILKHTDILQQFLTDEDILRDNSFNSLDNFNISCRGLFPHERALRFLELVYKSLNQDWVPDFDNSNQIKYEPRFTGGSSGFRFDGFDAWYSNSHVGSRLCFDTSDKAIHAGKTYTKWYKEAIIR